MNLTTNTPRLPFGYGRRLTKGSLLSFTSVFEIINGLSDRVTLSKFAEVEIVGNQGKPSTFVTTATLLQYPQIFTGYDEGGRPILLGITRTLVAHMAMLGTTRCGKTTCCALICYQLIRLGFPVVFLGNKTLDPMAYSTLLAACESKTRLDANLNKVSAPFRFITLQPNVRTSGFNYIAQISRDCYPMLLKAGNALQALNQGAAMDDRAGQFFAMSGVELLKSAPWGDSWRDLDAAIRKMRLDRDATYATSGLRNAISQMAANEALNIPSSHPAHVDLEWLIQENGALYFEGSGFDNGDLGGAGTALVYQAVVAAKRWVDPMNQKRLFVFIDEAQTFPRLLLRKTIEQAAGQKITLFIAAHTAEQFGVEDFPTIAQTGVTAIFSALQGARTEHYLRESFGTKKVYRISVGWTSAFSTGGAHSESGSSDGRSGESDSTQWNQQQGINIGLAEHEVIAWTSHDTALLNDSPGAFVIRVAPRDELVTLEVGGNRAIAAGPPLPYSEIDRIVNKVTEETPHTFLPGKPHRKALGSSASPENSPERDRALEKLRQAALRLQHTA